MQLQCNSMTAWRGITCSWAYMLAGLSEYITMGAPNVTVPPPAVSQAKVLTPFPVC